jgi:hypothetical protein
MILKSNFTLEFAHKAKKKRGCEGRAKRRANRTQGEDMKLKRRREEVLGRAEKRIRKS